MLSNNYGSHVVKSITFNMFVWQDCSNPSNAVVLEDALDSKMSESFYIGSDSTKLLSLPNPTFIDDFVSSPEACLITTELRTNL